MSTARERAETVARQFHETYERLAPQFGYKTSEASAVPWEDVPEQNKELMIATVDAMLTTDPACVQLVEWGQLPNATREVRDAYWQVVERAERAEASLAAMQNLRSQEQLNAVDNALGGWEPSPDSDTGVLSRVQTILNLKADRERLAVAMEALRWYADPANYVGECRFAAIDCPQSLRKERGEIARQALTRITEGAE